MSNPEIGTGYRHAEFQRFMYIKRHKMAPKKKIKKKYPDYKFCMTFIKKTSFDMMFHMSAVTKHVKGGGERKVLNVDAMSAATGIGRSVLCQCHVCCHWVK